MIRSSEKRSFRFLSRSKRYIPNFFQLGIVLAKKFVYLLHNNERQGDTFLIKDYHILFDPIEYAKLKQVRFASYSSNDPINRWMRFHDEGYIMFKKVLVISCDQ